MGRMLDTLKRADWPSVEPPSPPAVLAAGGEETPVEEMPFIEVGGSGPRVEASPSVWITNPGRVPAEPPAVAKPALQTPTPRTVMLTPRPPLSVALQSTLPAALPRPRLAAEIIAFHEPEHAVSRQYRDLLAAILAEVGGDGRALLFTALTPGAGASTAVLNLAVCAAADPRRQVIVVDANLQRPVLAKRLGLAAGPGLQEVLSGTAALEQVIQTTAQERLHALAAGAGTGRQTLLSGAASDWVLRWLRERYDLVLLDGAPWQQGGPLADLAAGADAVYLVLAEGQAEQPAVRARSGDSRRSGRGWVG